MNNVAHEKVVAGQKPSPAPQRLEVDWQTAPAQNIALLDATGTGDELNFPATVAAPLAPPAQPGRRCQVCAAPAAKA